MQITYLSFSFTILYKYMPSGPLHQPSYSSSRWFPKRRHEDNSEESSGTGARWEPCALRRRGNLPEEKGPAMRPRHPGPGLGRKASAAIKRRDRSAGGGSRLRFVKSSASGECNKAKCSHPRRACDRRRKDQPGWSSLHGCARRAVDGRRVEGHLHLVRSNVR